MKDESLDELRRELFEAARAEQPDARLEPRVIARMSLERKRERVPFAARWLVAAIVLACGAGVLALVRFTDQGGVAISREAVRGQPDRAEAPPAKAEPVSSASERELLQPTVQPVVGEPARAPKPALRSGERSRVDAGREATPAVKAPAAAAPDSHVAEPTSLAIEIDRLKRAREALRTDRAAEALELLEIFDSTESALAAEATLLRLDALRALGRHVEAAALAERFIAEQPDSPLSERAQTFLRPGAAAPPAARQSPRNE